MKKSVYELNLGDSEYFNLIMNLEVCLDFMRFASDISTRNLEKVIQSLKTQHRAKKNLVR